mmetsp:Transcript_10070/g.32834  ORF Transcript_10070/g.32834 Transcript_10070/m.32834 type:complete len:100 (+) Transcript_10070:198-497(+)
MTAALRLKDENPARRTERRQKFREAFPKEELCGSKVALPHSNAPEASSQTRRRLSQGHISLSSSDRGGGREREPYFHHYWWWFLVVVAPSWPRSCVAPC